MLTGGLVVLGHLHPLLVHAHHPTGSDHPKQRRHRQQLVTKGTDPTVGRDAGHPQRLAGPAVGAVAPGIHLYGQHVGLQTLARVGQQAGGQDGEAAVLAGRVVTAVAIDLHELHLALLIHEPSHPRLQALAPHLLGTTMWAAYPLRGDLRPGLEQHRLQTSEPRRGLLRGPRLQPRLGYGRLPGPEIQLLLRGQWLPRLQFAQQALQLGQDIAHQPILPQAQLPGSLHTQPCQYLPYDLPAALVGRLAHLAYGHRQALGDQKTMHLLDPPTGPMGPGLDDALLELEGQDLTAVLAEQASPVPLQPIPQPQTDVRLIEAQSLG